MTDTLLARAQGRPTLGLGIGLRLGGAGGPSGPPTLSTLGGTFALAENAVGGATAGSITGKKAASTLSLTDDAGGRVALSGNTIVRGATALNYEAATSHDFTLRETLVDATNSPHDTVLSLIVTNVAEITLNALTGTFTLPEDADAGDVAGALSGKTSGSTLSLANDAGGRVALSGSNVIRGATALDYDSATSHSFTVRETIDDAFNSPRDTILSLSVTEVIDYLVSDDYGRADTSPGHGGWGNADTGQTYVTSVNVQIASGKAKFASGQSTYPGAYIDSSVDSHIFSVVVDLGTQHTCSLFARSADDGDTSATLDFGLDPDSGAKIAKLYYWNGSGQEGAVTFTASMLTAELQGVHTLTLKVDGDDIEFYYDDEVDPRATTSVSGMALETHVGVREYSGNSSGLVTFDTLRVREIVAATIYNTNDNSTLDESEVSGMSAAMAPIDTQRASIRAQLGL